MPHLNYIRFENTVQDLRDCAQYLDAPPANESEERYRRLLIDVCQEIANNYGSASD